jgi:polyhydroxybutyrate depolymerase
MLPILGCWGAREKRRVRAEMYFWVMRWTMALCVLLTLVGCKRSKFDSDLHHLRHDGERRSYLLHVPAAYDADSATALIIALHGGVGSARNLEEQSGLTALSDEKGFLLCSPNGMNRTWNAGQCCGKAQEKDVDDVGFIRALIEEIEGEYNIDPKRIYVTGMSNGAMMSYRLACELGDRIAAIAPVAGTMVYDCAPTEPVSIIHFHSYEDSSVPFDGGIGDGISDHYNPPLDSVLYSWVIYNSCIELTSQSLDEYDVLRWQGCNAASDVVLYLTRDGGHSWPGGVAPRGEADPPSEAIDANALMWEFFEGHPKGG